MSEQDIPPLTSPTGWCMDWDCDQCPHVVVYTCGKRCEKAKPPHEPHPPRRCPCECHDE